jgi:hypothetical protein
MKKLSFGLIALAICGAAQAKLPPPTPEATAAAAAVKDKAAWGDKVAAYKLCLAQDKVAAHYAKTKNVAVKGGPEVPPCADPGPYVAAQQATQVGVADAKPVPAAGQQPQPAQPAQAAEAKK